MAEVRLKNGKQKPYLRYQVHPGDEKGPNGSFLMLETVPSTVDVVEVELLPTKEPSFQANRYVFEGFGRILSQLHYFLVTVLHNGRILVETTNDDSNHTLIFLYDAHPTMLLPPQRLPAPPKTAWEHLDELEAESAEPCPQPVNLTPGWGDNL